MSNIKTWNICIFLKSSLGLHCRAGRTVNGVMMLNKFSSLLNIRCLCDSPISHLVFIQEKWNTCLYKDLYTDVLRKDIWEHIQTILFYRWRNRHPSFTIWNMYLHVPFMKLPETFSLWKLLPTLWVGWKELKCSVGCHKNNLWLCFCKL